MLDISQADIGLLPGLELPILLDTILLFFFCSIRIAAFLIASPIFGAGYVILPIRILFGMVLTLSVFQNHSIVLDTETMASALGVILIVKEIAIGLSAGLVLTIWFSAASLAGEKIASTSGLAFAAQVDPNTGASTPVISQIFMLFLLVIFLAIDGHLIVLRTLLDSYEFIPIDSIPTLGILLKSGIGAAGSMFLAATVIMLPVSVILLMVNVSIGIMTRSAPTLNLFSFGFPITLLGTFIFLYLSASTIGFAMSDLVEASIQSMQDMIWGISNG
jgi:flagellar biosynthetic protein FliR